jgi:putative colanic acid biosynthesis acetyltransferase WcaF
VIRMIGDAHFDGFPPDKGLAPRFNLAGFTKSGYDRGAAIPVQILWVLLSKSVLMQWWCPNRLRIAILRAFGADIGNGVQIRHEVKIHWPWKLKIGDDSWIGEETWILNLENVTIGSNTCISQDVLLCTGSHDQRSLTFEFDNGPITIGDGVWVAARATVLRGVNIANNATIGANSLVVGDVPEWATVLAPLGPVSMRRSD